ncbi:hypothetical protein SAMN00777080_3955 [Aquiflexum balticum DSM 16537]|uniref:Uncharacterized protein n=1 Tax=Aquiflexum balticum DSM 16537 TaxID=758820 RepID=A0A1W2H9S1_9BACT|nr:hypothetical protein SAMN00777080_3955 [Aquiflexum balticum DSM 16537]
MGLLGRLGIFDFRFKILEGRFWKVDFVKDEGERMKDEGEEVWK